MHATAPAATLGLVKCLHTIAWRFFAGCIVAIPVAAYVGQFDAAAWLAAVFAIEVCVLVAKRLRCPLAAIAARCTQDRTDSFDIYLPRWLAKYNKVIFGARYVAGIVYSVPTSKPLATMPVAVLRSTP